MKLTGDKMLLGEHDVEQNSIRLGPPTSRGPNFIASDGAFGPT
jgi:hypothetical protein